MTKERQTDIAIVGAGIAGLAHALEAGKRGLKVVLFERHAQAQGASVRNFGAILPFEAEAGTGHDQALRSSEIWSDLAPKAGIWLNRTGAVLLAYHEDEWAILQEFMHSAGASDYDCTLLDRQQILASYPYVNVNGLLGGLFSHTEMIVDPREAIAKLPTYLSETYGVEIHFSTPVTEIDLPTVKAGGETWLAKYAVVCSGTELELLFPETFKKSGIIRSKLHMMRTVAQPDRWQMGPIFMGGLAMAHCPTFRKCPSLPKVQARLAAEYADYLQHGIHVVACQNGVGEVTIGHSSEHGWTISPFDNPEIDELILTHLRTMLTLPSFKIRQRWQAISSKHPEKPIVVETPAPNVRLICAGRLGMTASFGIAQDVLENLLKG